MTNSLLDTDDDDQRHARIFHLVGEFMWHWSLLEASLNSGVHKLCNLTSLEAHVVTTNMGVRDKIHAVRTMLNLCFLSDPDASKVNNKLMDGIAKLSGDRNLVAHTGFAPPEKGDGVMFLVIKAKGTFQVPDVIWSEADFARKNREMYDLKRRLDATVRTGVARRARRNTGNIFAQGLMTAPPPEPTEGTGLLSGLLALGHQALEPLGSPPPTPTAGLQTQEAPAPRRKGSRKPKD